MTGKDFVAVVRISDKADKTLAEVGATCEKVPANALGWLEEGGSIRRLPPQKQKRTEGEG